MICPKCRLTMRPKGAPSVEGQVYVCGGCGYHETDASKKSSQKITLPPRDSLPPEKTEFMPAVKAEPEIKETTPQEDKTESQPRPQPPSPSKRKKSKHEAKTATEEVEVSKDPVLESKSKNQPEETKELRREEITTFTRKKNERRVALEIEKRRIARDLLSRVNDLEIQVDRRMEEIQNLLADLNRLLEKDDLDDT